MFRQVFGLAILCALAGAWMGLAGGNANAEPLRRNLSATKPAAFKPAATPARFFTIDQVLAKRDSRGLRYASLPTVANDAAPPRQERSTEPFGLFAFRAPDGLLRKKWQRIQTELQIDAREIAQCGHGGGCSPAAYRLSRLSAQARSRSGSDRIAFVNREINAAIRYRNDFAQHGVADLWTAPVATLAAGAGDCEDYAIAKYAALIAAGVPASELRILLVRDRAVRQDHAVLAARNGERWLILDNRWSELREDHRLSHFTPLFALDQHGVSLFAAPYAGTAARGLTNSSSQPLVDLAISTEALTGFADAAIFAAGSAIHHQAEAAKATNPAASGSGSLPILL